MVVTDFKGKEVELWRLKENCDTPPATEKCRQLWRSFWRSVAKHDLYQRMLHLETTGLGEVGRISSSDLYSLLPSPSSTEIICITYWGISVPGTLAMPWGCNWELCRSGKVDFHHCNHMIRICHPFLSPGLFPPNRTSSLKLAEHDWFSGYTVKRFGESIWLKMDKFWLCFPPCRVCFQPDQAS